MKEFRRHFTIVFLVSAFFAVFFLFTRINLLIAYDQSPLEEAYLYGTTLGIFRFFLVIAFSGLLALGITSLDFLVIKQLARRKSLATVLSATFLTQFAVIALIILTFNNLIHIAIETITGAETEKANHHEIYVWIAFVVLTILFSRFIIEVDKKLGPGNLWKMITGKFYNPREEERIFMFIDLKSSTTIAEKLGHFNYSKLIQDCFRDLSIIDKYNAEVYQYVGDEVVITWPVTEAQNYRKFLSAFFAFRDTLEKKRNYYEGEYGVFPTFKAGAHAGPAVVTEVGELKKEITYHGDTVNTTARIQDVCNQFKVDLLISESLYEIIKSYSPYVLEDVGTINLKGKKSDVRLFKVTEPQLN